MRITAELITRSPSYLNPLKERELDLRGIVKIINEFLKYFLLNIFFFVNFIR